MVEEMKPVLKGGKYYYDGDAQPDCFSELFDPTDNDCQNVCGFVSVCAPKFVATTLTKCVKRLGTKANPKTVAKELQMTEKGAEAVLKILENDSSPTKKAAPKKAPPKKKKAPTKGVAAKVPPSKAGPSAKNATGPASTPTRSKRSAPSASAQDGATEPFGEHTWMDRWTRERKRSKKVGALKLGQVLKVTRKLDGVPTEFKVKVLKGHYVYLGDKTKHPTLYKLTEHITGKGSSWSGPKFWKLT